MIVIFFFSLFAFGLFFYYYYFAVLMVLSTAFFFVFVSIIKEDLFKLFLTVHMNRKIFKYLGLGIFILYIDIFCIEFFFFHFVQYTLLFFYF